MHASRGCPYSCYFCGSLNKNHRYRSPENILKELNVLKQKYKIDGFVINDENFIINEKKVLEICKEVKKLNMPWSALSRVNTINEKIIKHLKKSNCIELKFGLETGSNKMMKYMNKNTTCEQAEKALSLCNKYGIKAKIFLIHGFPGENIDTTTETINFLKKNRKFINRITLFQWTPLPGSYVYNNPSKFGIDPKMLTFENAVIYGENQGFFLKDKINKEINESYLILNDFIKNSFN
ncbi:B12-binding domain-containing radical SAM protein [Psychrilyobacter atlanticus]|uniref:B12-binding domain-containing radical SAM protein n=1 Tax=Psychrilyobacter atlanticus TaxID=271091 RepID=UPI001FE0F460|nr:radical SAM protein [Psychrilyobacter atlanticus]